MADHVSRKILLVVEDDSTTREWLATVLEAADYAVVLAANGREALEYLRQNPAPDLILLDMLMPILDGWHFLKRIRNIRRAVSVPVLVTTATILTPEWAAQNGCAGCLRKPIESEALLGEVGRCLVASPAPAN